MAADSVTGTSVRHGAMSGDPAHWGRAASPHWVAGMRNRWFRLALGIALLIDIPCSFFIPIDCDVASSGTSVEWTFLWEFETHGLFFGDAGIGRVLLVLAHAMICCSLLVLGARSLIRFVEETY